MRKITTTIGLYLLAGTALAQQMPASVVQVATVEHTEIAPTVAVPGTIYSRNELQVTGCDLDRVSFVAGAPPTDRAVTVKVRYRSRPVPAVLEGAEGRWALKFSEPQLAVAPGQAVVAGATCQIVAPVSTQKRIRAAAAGDENSRHV